MMAPPRDPVTHNPASPHSSSGGAESFKGTPDTRLTAFSPEEGAGKSMRFSDSLGLMSSGSSPVRHRSGNATSAGSPGGEDPFVTTNRVSTTSQLSPTATSFHPSLIDMTPSLSATSGEDPLAAVDHPAVDLAQGATNCIMIFSSVRALRVEDATAFLQKLERLGILPYGPRQLHGVPGGIYVRFGDVYSALLAHDSIHQADVSCETYFITESRYSQVTNNSLTRPYISILAFPTVPGITEQPRTEAIVQGLLESHGEISVYYRLPNPHGPGVYAALAEYLRHEDTTSAVAACNGRVFEGLVVHLSVVPPAGSSAATASRADSAISHNMDWPETSMISVMQNLSLTKSVPGTDPANNQPSISQVGNQQYPLGYQQPWGIWPVVCPTQYRPNVAYVLDSGNADVAASAGNYQVVGPFGSQPGRVVPLMNDYRQPRSMPSYARPEISRRQNAARVHRSTYCNSASHHNHVDVARIREGSDVRTTIMLRNIPNKVDQAMLKRIVDESSWGKYDFMYLRIDFANDCNVGYAFINFVDPLDIIDFVNARGNQRWNCFKSDKVAEISYATIQGKDCLVQKFRNSSVMLEAAHYRPKLFHTSNGPMPDLAGQEEAFPPPDNQSKMKRSCENAEHVGLFTPNAGQHFRDEQRRRRSQYDRGTRLAALEEHDFESAMASQLQFTR